MTNAKKIFGKTKNIHVAGTTFEGRQDKIWALRKSMANGDKPYLTLRREKTNEHDPNAIQVIAHVKGARPFCVGYVPRNKSIWLAPAMDAGRIVRASHINILGNGANYKFGVTFDLTYELPNLAAAVHATI